MTKERAPNLFKNKSHLGIVVALAIVAVLYLAVLLITKNENTKTRYAKADIVSLDGRFEAQAFQATLKNKSGVHALELKDNTLLLPPEVVQNFSVPYVIEARWQNKPDTYKDITWSMDARGVGYIIGASGFSPDDKISLFVNKENPIKDMPFDWAGRTELPVLLQADNDFDICVEIKPENEKSLRFCHRIIGKKAGVV